MGSLWVDHTFTSEIYIKKNFILFKILRIFFLLYFERITVAFQEMNLADKKDYSETVCSINKAFSWTYIHQFPLHTFETCPIFAYV